MYPPEAKGKYQLLGWMPQDQYDALKQSIRADERIHLPIIQDDEGITLDGFHRELIADELKKEGVKVITPSVTILVGLDERGKRDFVLKTNLNRRQISQEERRDLIRAELHHSSDLNNSWIADICGTTDKTVASVRKELESASEIPTLTTFKRRDGKSQPSTIHTNTAHERKRALDVLPKVVGEKLPARTTVKKLERIARYKRLKDIAESEIPSPPDDIQLLHRDFRQLDISENSIPLILTDPLYETDALPLWSALAEFAAAKLTDDGLLVAYCGVATLPQCLKVLESKLHYIWTMCIVLSGEKSYAAKIHGRNGWRPVLLFSKSKLTERLAQLGLVDVLDGSRREKQYHPYQQGLSEAEYFVGKFSNAGEVICDPFAGSFTNAVAAWKKGRKFIGCDIEEQWVQVGKHRLAEAMNSGEATEQPKAKVISTAPMILPVQKPERTLGYGTAEVTVPPGVI